MDTLPDALQKGPDLFHRPGDILHNWQKQKQEEEILCTLSGPHLNPSNAQLFLLTGFLLANLFSTLKKNKRYKKMATRNTLCQICSVLSHYYPSLLFKFFCQVQMPRVKKRFESHKHQSPLHICMYQCSNKDTDFLKFASLTEFKETKCIFWGNWECLVFFTHLQWFMKFLFITDVSRHTEEKFDLWNTFVFWT